MFTGIITDIGRVKSVETQGDARFVLETGYDTASIDIGASISCSGACLTVVDKGPNWFAVDVSGETLAKTNLGDWRPDMPVNLERALCVGDELGGHIVTGHVDGVGEIISITGEGGSQRLRLKIPKSLAGFIAPKGGVAVDGVSLTVNEVLDEDDACIFGVNIIPHTREETTFHFAKTGGKVNIEIDVLARYVARLKDVH